MKHTQVLIDLLYKRPDLKIIAEVGVEKGRLMRNILRSPASETIEEYWAIDQWKPLGPKYGSIGYRTRRDWYELYKRVCGYMRWFKQLRILRMASLEAAEMFPDGYFDFVYIDADHCYPEVCNDITAWLPKVRRGGILAGHDYNIGSVRRAVDELLGDVFLPPPGDTKVWLKDISYGTE